MKNLKRSIASVILVLLLLLSSFVPSFASESGVLTYSSEYNSGTRNVVCTTLEGTSAASYYTGNYTYDYLSELSAESLFSSLQTLMRSTQTYTSSYDDCHYEADRTDCQNGDKSVSLIYTGYSATMDEWNGWNREHVWPKSNGGNSETGGGADLHHIRPSDSGVNSSRGNKKYGESGSNPTEKYGTDPAVGWLGGTFNSTYFEPLDNVKGDVARICLYVYVRWNSDWGAEDVTKVFQSVDVLLAWCEADPVDTWEMGRNEVVQDIQGNRNVFIDYPEYAWLIFGREVPTNMATPSGEASGGELGGGSAGGGSSDCSHTNKTTTTTNATCTVAGSIIVTCTDCGATVSNTTIAATGHSYVDGECSVCGELQGAAPQSSTVSVNIADYADENGWSNGVQYSSVIMDENITVTASGGANTGKYYTSGENWRIYKSESPSIVVTAKDGYIISSVKITYASADSGVLTLNGSNVSSGSAVDVGAESVTFSVGNTGGANNGQVRITDIEVVYEKESASSCEHTNQTTVTTNATCTVAGSIIVTCTDCGATVSNTTIPATGHQNTSTSTTDATCTEAGSIIVTCTDCGEVISTDEIAALGHTTDNGVCENCGNTIGGEATVIPEYVKVTSADEFTTGTYVLIVSTENITVSTFDGSWIKGSELVAGDTIAKADGDALAITLEVNGSGVKIKIGDEYVKPKSGNNNGIQSGSYDWAYEFNSDGTIVFKGVGSDTTILAYNVQSAGFRAYKTSTVSGSPSSYPSTFSVYKLVEASGGDACEHTNTTTDTVNATCTEAGSITVTCDSCGETVSYTVTDPPTGHQNTSTSTTDATCTEAGSIIVTCTDCGEVVSTDEIAALGHTTDNGVCENCGNTIGGEATVIPEYVKVTSADEFTTGTYVLIVSTKNITVSTFDGSWIKGSELTAGDTIAKADGDALAITLEVNGSSVKIKIGDTYVKPKSGNTNGITSGSYDWAYEFNSDGTIVFKGVGSDTTILAYNVQNAGFRAYKTTTVSGSPSSYPSTFSVYKLVDCEHTNTTTDTVNATCTESGSITVTCTDCGATVSNTTIPATGHTYVDEICIRCGYTENNTSQAPTGEGWTLVTDATELKAGDKIVIISGEFVAGNISSTFLAPVSGVTVSDNTITTLPDGAIILTLGGSEGAWTLSNNSEQLLGATDVKKLAWDSGTTTWSISISGNNATIQNGTSSYGRMLYNVNDPRFTTYTSNASSSMLLPQIYKYIEASGDSGEVEISAASMTVGSTLAMNYYVSGYDDGAEYYMVFTMNGVESEHVVGVIKNGYLVFSFTDIPPQHMGDSISASLFIDGNETPVDVVENYSVKRYAEKIIEKYSSDEKLMNLIADMLRYGAAAQLYRNYKTDELVTENLETNGFDISTVGSNAIPTESDDVRSMYPKSNVSELTDSVTAVGVRFDYDNKIYVKFKTDDIAKIKFTVTVNGTETNVSDRFTSVSDGVYIFYTDGISAIRFDQIFTFKMYVDGELHQTVTYSVNSYVYAKCGDTGTLDESTLPAMARLVRALYRYGLSAKAYKG